jgi:hypothetical protein
VQSHAQTVSDDLAAFPAKQCRAIEAVRRVVLENLPARCQQSMQCGGTDCRVRAIQKRLAGCRSISSKRHRYGCRSMTRPPCKPSRKRGKSKMIISAAVIAIALATVTSSASAEEFRLAPYKDKLFANPKPFKTMYGDSLEMVEYSVERDLYGRDEVPEKKAKAKYVSEIDDAEYDLTLRDGEIETQLLAVGNVDKPKIVVMFLHGRGAGRQAGFNDWNFGGNFNRIKNLMLRNDGVYVSPSFSDFRESGKNEVKGIMKAFAEKAPGVPIFIACASAAGALCVSLADDAGSRSMLAGVLFLGAGVRDIESAAKAFTEAKPPVPIFIGHGSDDAIVDWVRLELFLKEIKKANNEYPIRFRLFVSGQHGTPMRMTDWRQVLIWMLEVRDGTDQS